MGDSGGLGATCGVLELEQVGCWMSLVPAFTERPWRKLRHEHLEYIKCEARQLRPCFGRNAYNTHGVAFFFFFNTEIKGFFSVPSVLLRTHLKDESLLWELPFVSTEYSGTKYGGL